MSFPNHKGRPGLLGGSLPRSNLAGLFSILKGGAGSGNIGHAGVPGKRGGSAPSSFVGSSVDKLLVKEGLAVSKNTVDSDIKKINNKWIDSSIRKESKIFRTAVTNVLGGSDNPNKYPEQVKDYKPRSQDVKKAEETVKKVYESTQAALNQLGVKTVKIYRGLFTNDPKFIEQAKEGKVSLKLDSVSSFSSDQKVSSEFLIPHMPSDFGKHAFLLEMEVPAKHVLSSYKLGIGDSSQKEWLIASMGQEFQAKVVESEDRWVK